MASALDDDLRRPSLADAIVPLVVPAALIAGALALFGLDALDGPIQVALLLCCAVAALIAMKNGHDFAAIQDTGRGATLGVSTLLYLPYAVLCDASPALSVLYGVTGFRIEKTEPTTVEEKS